MMSTQDKSPASSHFVFYFSAPFDKCNSPILAGPCKEPVARYGYDAVTGTCKPFTYGGCGGNENRYETHEKCEYAITKCSNKGTSTPFDKCYAAIAGGPCRAAIEKYGYNVVTGACEHFTYGGCAGNANRYELLEDCEIATADCTNTGSCDSSCIDLMRFVRSAKAPPQMSAHICRPVGQLNPLPNLFFCFSAHFDKCNSPIDKGTCDDSVPRYGYDAAAGVCKPFIWGGCDGNANKYGTQEQCETATATCPNRGIMLAGQMCCSTLSLLFISPLSLTFDFYISAPFDKCNAALITGYGREAHPRFGYDAATGACRPFIWGGSGGNANRFETQRECETATASCSGRSNMYLELYVPCQRLW
ncbi:unnamed protein product [Dibothriocephalus latus]|uniref:BPTI/Kunitz inhibitor domain-containing protein n=1 Tax=Dibothriocephalus latus TaxID=60516 RepID=A0A3P7L3U9_DIBLA|nr:unnamed protein product [Dibothriocephalus latus]